MYETVFVKKKKKMAQQPFSDHFKAQTFCVDDPQSFWKNLKYHGTKIWRDKRSNTFWKFKKI